MSASPVKFGTAMSKVTVYRYYTFIIGKEVSARAPRAAILETIERVGGVPLFQTARDVHVDHVDAEGYERDRTAHGAPGHSLH